MQQQPKTRAILSLSRGNLVIESCGTRGIAFSQRTVLPNEKVTKDPSPFSLRNNILSLKYNQQFQFQFFK